MAYGSFVTARQVPITAYMHTRFGALGHPLQVVRCGERQITGVDIFVLQQAVIPLVDRKARGIGIIGDIVFRPGFSLLS